MWCQRIFYKRLFDLSSKTKTIWKKYATLPARAVFVRLFFLKNSLFMTFWQEIITLTHPIHQGGGYEICHTNSTSTFLILVKNVSSIQENVQMTACEAHYLQHSWNMVDYGRTCIGWNTLKISCDTTICLMSDIKIHNQTKLSKMFFIVSSIHWVLL